MVATAMTGDDLQHDRGASHSGSRRLSLPAYPGSGAQAHPREKRCIETMPGELHEGIGITSLTRAVILGSAATGERIEGGAQGGTPHRVEKSFDEGRSAFAGTHLERSVFDVPEPDDEGSPPGGPIPTGSVG
jgi:hypothetical protein